MGDFFYKIFIKNYKDTQNPEVRISYGLFASILGIILNLLLSASKLIAGAITNSISITADGINNLSDASSSIITLIGFKLSGKPQDEKHPFGHARIEYLTGLVISILIILVGINLGKASFDRLFTDEKLSISPMILIFLIVSIVLKAFQCFVNLSIGKKIDSKTLTVTAADSRNDILSTTAVLMGAFISYNYDVHIDGYIGIMVSAFIVYSGISLTLETASPLIGEKPSDDLVENIRIMILRHKDVIGIHDLIVHNYGAGKVFASAHIEVDSKRDIMVSHELVDNIERELSSSLNINFVAHIDPVELNNPLLTEVLPEIESVISSFEGLSDIHDVRFIKGENRVNIIFDIVSHDTFSLEEDDVNFAVNERLKSLNPKYNAIITFDKAYTNL